jgi:small-conductance mechanosensitive channel
MNDGEVVKAVRIPPSEDSDSYNYTQHDSESLSTDDSREDQNDREEAAGSFEKFKASAYETLRQRVVWIVILGLGLLLAGTVCWNVEFQIKDKYGVPTQTRLRNVLYFLSLCVYLCLAMNFFIFKLSFLALRRAGNLNTFFYYTNELSEHISIGIFLVVGVVVIALKDLDRRIYSKENFTLYMGDLLNSLVVTVFMLSCVKIAQRATSMNFNYSMYIKRIRRVLLEDAFISLLGLAETKANARIDRIKTTGSQEVTYKNDAITSINDYLSDLHSYGEPASGLDIPSKRVILKEFQRLIKHQGMNRKEFVQISHRLKQKAGSKASKIIGKDATLRPLAEYTLYFYKMDLFKFLLKEIGLSESYRFTRSALAEFIERSFRERYLLKENLDHMNSAIDRVAFALKMVIWCLSLILLYIRASGQGATTIGLISAIFGTQVISNSFSSSILTSIIFLFFIHPYDIGDRIFVTLDGNEENLAVSELNVLSTVFYRWDGTYITILNTVLAQKHIKNLRRSGIMAESHKIQINSRTNQKKLIRLKELLEDFVKANSEDYTEFIMLNYECIENANKLHMKVFMQYKSSWQDYELYLRRKTKFLSFLNRAMNELEIEYILPPLRVHVSPGER